MTRLSLRSRLTSCSSSSTSGRRSTSRRPALTHPSTPERARLPQPPCLPPARVTVVLSYMPLAGVIRSGPFPRCGRGRERSMSWEAGASPATAHWAAAGPPTKVRSSPRASNSAPFCLILTFCLPLLPSLWPSSCHADATSGVQERSDGRQGRGPQPYKPPGHSRRSICHSRAYLWTWPSPAAPCSGRKFLLLFWLPSA